MQAANFNSLTDDLKVEIYNKYFDRDSQRNFRQISKEIFRWNNLPKLWRPDVLMKLYYEKSFANFTPQSIRDFYKNISHKVFHYRIYLPCLMVACRNLDTFYTPLNTLFSFGVLYSSYHLTNKFTGFQSGNESSVFKPKNEVTDRSNKVTDGSDIVPTILKTNEAMRLHDARKRNDAVASLALNETTDLQTKEVANVNQGAFAFMTMLVFSERIYSYARTSMWGGEVDGLANPFVASTLLLVITYPAVELCNAISRDILKTNSTCKAYMKLGFIACAGTLCDSINPFINTISLSSIAIAGIGTALLQFDKHVYNLRENICNYPAAVKIHRKIFCSVSAAKAGMS